MSRNAILPIRITRDPLACARVASALSALADSYRSHGEIGPASQTALTLLAVLAGEVHPPSAVPVRA